VRDPGQRKPVDAYNNANQRRLKGADNCLMTGDRPTMGRRDRPEVADKRACTKQRQARANMTSRIDEHRL